MSLFMTLATFGSYKAIAPEIIFVMYNHSVSDDINQKENQLSKFFNNNNNKKKSIAFPFAKFWELNFISSNFIFS